MMFYPNEISSEYLQVFFTEKVCATNDVHTMYMPLSLYVDVRARRTVYVNDFRI